MRSPVLRTRGSAEPPCRVFWTCLLDHNLMCLLGRCGKLLCKCALAVKDTEDEQALARLVQRATASSAQCFFSSGAPEGASRPYALHASAFYNGVGRGPVVVGGQRRCSRFGGCDTGEATRAVCAF